MIVWTICARNYLAQAAILSASVQEHCQRSRPLIFLLEPNWRVHGADKDQELEVQIIDDVLYPGVARLCFCSGIVEAATAVKPALMLHLLEVFETEDEFLFLDPDVEVFSDLSELSGLRQPLAVTPHFLASESFQHRHLAMLALEFGAFNLGFLYLRRSAVATRFLRWWKRMLLHSCVNEPTSGRFLDQKWIDVAISLFDVGIIRHPGYNVANWNALERCVRATRYGYRVNGVWPLRFVHFSDVGSGRDLRRWLEAEASRSPHSDVLSLRRRYLERVENGATNRTEWGYDRFDSGERITSQLKAAVRSRPDLVALCKNPFAFSSEFWFSVLSGHPALALSSGCL